MIQRGPSGLSIVGEAYESLEFNVSTATTNQNVKTTNSGFATVEQAQHVIIRTDNDVTIRFNKTTNDAITLEGGTSLVSDGILVTNIFITNDSGNTAAIKILIS